MSDAGYAGSQPAYAGSLEDDVLDVLEEAILDESVQKSAEQFMAQHLHLFEGMTDEQLTRGGCEGEEQSIAWHQVYKQYTDMMEQWVIGTCIARDPRLNADYIYAVLSNIAVAPAGNDVTD